jgi:CHAT domain-containing protein
MTYRASLHLLQAVLAIVMAVSCARPVKAYSAVGQSGERVTAASSSQKEEGRKINKQAISLMEAGNLDEALKAFNRAIELSRQAGDPEGEANALANIGFVYITKEDWSKAREYCTRALSFFRTKGDPASEVDLLIKIAFTFESERNYNAAVSHYQQAIPLLQAIGNRKYEATVIISLSASLREAGKPQDAIDLLLKALPLFNSLNDPASEGMALWGIATAYGDLGHKQNALSYHEKSLAKWEAIGDRAREAGALLSMGIIERDLGHPEQALRHYNKSLAIWRGLKDPQSPAKQALLLGLIGRFYESINDMRRALTCYDEALSLAQSLNDDAGKATALDNMGRVSAYQDKYDQALTFFEKSLALWRSLNKAKEEAQTLSFMGNACNWAGEYWRAATYLSRSLAICQRTQDRAAEADVLGKLGMVYAKMIILRIPFQNSSEIQVYLSLAFKRTQDVPNPAEKIRLLARIGLIYTLLGDTERALENHRQALTLAESLKDEEGKAAALFHIGYAYETRNKPREALEFYNKSLAIHDNLRDSAHLEEIKTGLSGSATDAYKRAIALSMQLGEPAHAFDLSERARARTLLDQLANLRPKAKKKASAELLREEQALRSELFRLENDFKQGDSKNGSQLTKKRSEYEDLLFRLKLADPEYASLQTVDAMTLGAVQKLISKDATLISYFVTDVKTMIFVITRDSFQAVKVDVREVELNGDINWFRQFTTLSDSAPEGLKILYERLIAPVRSYIKTPTVAIIPHGVLNYLPFAALTDGRRYFGEEHAIYYLPSASVLKFIQKEPTEKQMQPSGNQILALAQSEASKLVTLEHADEEAETVANLFRAKALGTGKASKATFLKQASEYHVLHIAAHGELDPVNPLFSRIWLSPDEKDTGALTVHEVYDMDLPKTGLVVLSACNTQLGAHSKGDDIVGLNRAFIYAGASSVIASLWAVDDEATSFLMRSFYTHLKRGMGKAAALRAAQAETRRENPNPYYWAAFVLTGNAGPVNRPYSTSRISVRTRPSPSH